MIRLFKLIIFLGVVLFIVSLIPSSIDWAEGVIDRYQDKPWAATAYYQLGNHAYRVLQFDRALEIYKKALRKDPEHVIAPIARFRIGVCYERQKKYREAIRAYEGFIRKDPRHYLVPQAKNKIKTLKELNRD